MQAVINLSDANTHLKKELTIRKASPASSKETGGIYS